MKKFTILSILLSISFSIYSQNSTDVYKPDIKEFGVSFQVTGINGLIDSPFSEAFNNSILNLKYVKSEKLYYTLGLGLEINSQKDEKKDSIFIFNTRQLNTKTDKTSQTILSLIPGIEYHFGGTPRLDPYLGINLPLKYIGALVNTKLDVSNGVNSDNKAISSSFEDTNTKAGGFGFGLGFLAGFNYYITDRFSLGLEYRIGFDWAKMGGTEKFSHKESINNAGTITNDNYESSNYASESSFEGINNGIIGLNILYFFGEK